MSTYLIVSVIGFWIALLQAGLVTLVPTRQPVLFLPLLATVILVAEYRRPEAVVIVLASGLTLDAISSFPPGVNTILLTAGLLVGDFLFQRVFTNQSTLATIGLHGTVFVLWTVGLTFMRAIRATLLGWPWVEVGVWPVWWLLVIGAAVQALAALTVLFARRFALRQLAQGFMLTRRKERGWR
jgi:hypothetical protein